MNRREFIKNTALTGTVAVLLAEYGTSAHSLLPLPFRNKPTALDRPPDVLRPPGALPERQFLARCLRCQRCATVCPNNAILPLDSTHGRPLRNTPYIKPRRQACMLCNRLDGDYLKCTRTCPSGALRPIRKQVDEICRNVKMGTARIDESLCYSYNNWSCGACFRACPLPGRAMKLGLWEKPEVVADKCIGCGSCERACIRYPQAIRVQPRETT